jgi:hypothetical protein
MRQAHLAHNAPLASILHKMRLTLCFGGLRLGRVFSGQELTELVLSSVEGLRQNSNKPAVPAPSCNCVVSLIQL